MSSQGNSKKIFLKNPLGGNGVGQKNAPNHERKKRTGDSLGTRQPHTFMHNRTGLSK